MIVAGVLIALAADRWNQGRLEASAEASYVERLELDIRDDSLRAELFLASGPAISAANAAMVDLLRTGEGPADLVATIVTAFEELILPAPATWNDLQSTGALSLLRDPDTRLAVVSYYSARQEVALQVERTVRRGRDPFMDQLYPMGLFRPRIDRDGRADCIGETCFEPVPREVFASWPGMERLLAGLESGHGAQQVHARRLIAFSGVALSVLADWD